MICTFHPPFNWVVPNAEFHVQVWRVSFALGAIPLAFMIYYRIFRLRESAVWVKRTDSSRSASMGLLFKWCAIYYSIWYLSQPIHRLQLSFNSTKHHVSWALGRMDLIWILWYRREENSIPQNPPRSLLTDRGNSCIQNAVMPALIYSRMLLLACRYWHRLVATCGGWFLWDFSFYGNKVFQSTFIGILSPGASIFTTLLWTLLNSGERPQHWFPFATLPRLFPNR